MTSKNKGFAADLTASLGAGPELPKARSTNPILSGRTNALAEIASGAKIQRTHELVDPARCRMWYGHNRDYVALNEQRCSDLIESLKAQNRQEVPAIVRRVRGDHDFDFEVICGARRHWAVSWLRKHNYPEFRFLVEVRELTDEEAFRVADLENRAREDLTDLERARDYLKALAAYYDGKQKAMAERMNVTESWLSRYLDLARFPDQLLEAFADPYGLKIKHVTQLKPLLKPDDVRQKVLAEASRIAADRGQGREMAPTVADAIRLLTKAAQTPNKTGAPNKTGFAEVYGANRKLLMQIEKQTPKAVTVTFHPKSGASREEARTAVMDLIERIWGN